MSKETPQKETSVRMQVDTRNKMKAFAKKKGLKLSPMLTRGLNRTLKEHPEFFMP